MAMPTYVYRFVDTDETIEIQQSFSDPTLNEFVHPTSGATMRVKKVFLPVGVTFKGDGFYKTDSRSSKKAAKSSGSSESKDSSTSSSDSSSESSSKPSKAESSTKDSSPKESSPKPSKDSSKKSSSGSSSATAAS